MDASDQVDFTEWRIVRLKSERQVWPFLELDVGESFVEGDVSKWGSLRTRACTLRRKFLDKGLDRAWSVRRQGNVISVRRTE